MVDRPRRSESHRVIRFECRPIGSTGQLDAGRMVGTGSSPTHANVPHGALCVLQRAFTGHQQNQLWSPMRSTCRAATRPRGQASRVTGRHRLPKHVVQCDTSERGGDCWQHGGSRSRFVPSRTAERERDSCWARSPARMFGDRCPPKTELVSLAALWKPNATHWQSSSRSASSR